MDELSREIEALGSGDDEVRMRALARLSSRTDPGVINALYQALEHENNQVRKGICTALGNRGDTRAIECLVRLLDDPDQEVALSALDSLGQLQDARVINPLIIALGNIFPPVRRRAAQMLSRWGISFAQTLVDALDKKTGAIEMLMELQDKRVVYPLLKARISKNVETRWSAHEALSQLGEFTVDPFIEALKSSNRKIVIQAAGYLGKLGDSRAMDPLLNLLEGEDVEIRKAAIHALGAIGDPKSIAFIRKSIDNEKLSTPAIEALGIFGGDEAFEILKNLIKSDNANKAVAAARSLGQMGDARAIDPLYEQEKETKDERVKEEIHGAIEQIVTATSIYEDNFAGVRCSLCFGHFKKYALKYSFFRRYNYFACEDCKCSQGISNLNEVVAVLDKDMEESKRQDSGYLLINWFQNRFPFQFERLMLRGVGDEELSEFMKISVDGNKSPNFKKIMSNITVFVFPSCNLSKKKLDLLYKKFGEVEMVKPKEE